MWREPSLSLSVQRRFFSSFLTWLFAENLLRTLFHTEKRNRPSVLLTRLSRTDTVLWVASYSHFLGRSVTVQYRVGDILLPASGVFAADSGRSIFLEQHVEQHGKRSYFRWEIPYGYIHRIEEAQESQEQDAEPAPGPTEKANHFAAAAGAGLAPSGAPSILPVSHRPKTA